MSANATTYRTSSLRDIVYHFTPAWFTVTMGTGAISMLFYSYPYGDDTQPMKVSALLFFFLNLLLFFLFMAMSAARFILFPETWSRMLRHPTESLYLSTFPMGATTLISFAIRVVFQSYGFGGAGFVYTIWGLWWLDVALSFISCFWLVHIMRTCHEHSLRTMTSTWLLPVVPLVVASSTGGVIAPALQEYSPSHALLTIVCSLFMVTIGLSLSLMISTIYILRLAVYGYPTGVGIMSSFIPLGPSSQAAYSILLIGESLQSLLPLTYGMSGIPQCEHIGDAFNVICVAIAIMLWSFSTMWVIYAILGIQEIARRDRIPFKLSFWSIIFPNAVYANLTIQLYRTFDSHFFKVWGAIYAASTVVLWICVAVPTLCLIPGGVIFDSELPSADLAAEASISNCQSSAAGMLDSPACAAESS